jgi:hypothetical protein
MPRVYLTLILLTLASASHARQLPLEPLAQAQSSQAASVTLPAEPETTFQCDPEPADDWLLMRGLSSTTLGKFLQRNEIEIYGWTEGAFTASSASGNQLPLGFNYRANDFLLQQNWLRVERKLQTESSTASFGFLADTILP